MLTVLVAAAQSVVHTPGRPLAWSATRHATPARPPTRLAMQEELAYFCDKVWVGVPLSEALADADGKIIGSRWVNCNKNDINDPDVRCRLVAQEINLHHDDSFYAATPPLEAKRMLFSEWASTQDTYRQISFIDVKKAYFFTVCRIEIYMSDVLQSLVCRRTW